MWWHTSETYEFLSKIDLKIWTGIVWLKTGSSCECSTPSHSSRAPSARAPGPNQYRAFTITNTPHAVGFLRTSDRPVAEIPAWHHTHTHTHKHTQETDTHDPGGIRTRSPGKRAATDPRLRPRGHWDRLWMLYVDESSTSLNICNLLTSCMIKSC